MTAHLLSGTDHQIGPDAGPQAGPRQSAGRRQPANAEPEHGLYAVLACLLVLAVLDGVALAIFGRNVTDAVAVIGAISSPIVAMVSAYFGMRVGARTGSAAAAAAGAARTEAENEAKSLLGHMTPEQAKPLMKRLGIPVAG